MNPEQAAPIDVLLCGNLNYFQHMGVTICSLLVNNPSHRFRITIVTDPDIPDEIAKMQALVTKFGRAELRFPGFDTSLIAAYPVGHHFTREIFIRLFAPTLFENTVSKVLYLDGDLVVCRDIGPLWQTDLGDSPIAGVPDVYIDLDDRHQKPQSPRTYINSGVVLLNLAQWRREDATNALMSYIDAHRSELDYPDQDALNAVFADRIHFLPYWWNFQSDFAQLSPETLGMTREEFAKIRGKPGIVHYSSRWKPWLYGHETNYRHLYWKYLAMTPWRGFVPKDRTPKDIVMKAVRLKTLKRMLRWHSPGLFRLVRRMRGKVGR